MKRKNLKRTEAKNSSQSANEYDFVSQDGKMKVKIDFNPVMNKGKRNALHIYDRMVNMQIMYGNIFRKVLFGKNERVNENLEWDQWNRALVAINGNYMFVPYNSLISDKSKSMLFNPYLDKGFVLSREQAVLTMASFIYTSFNFYREKSHKYMAYVLYASIGHDMDWFYLELKMLAIANDKSMSTYRILD